MRCEVRDAMYIVYASLSLCECLIDVSPFDGNISINIIRWKIAALIIDTSAAPEHIILVLFLYLFVPYPFKWYTIGIQIISVKISPHFGSFWPKRSILY